MAEEDNFCWLMSFTITSDALILAPSITYPDTAGGSELLKAAQELLNIPIVFSKEDRPPEVNCTSV